MTSKEATTREYELAYLVKESSGSDIVRQAIIQRRGEIFSEEPPEKITLAYKIKKHSLAYWGWLHFRLSPEALTELSRELRVNPAVLRFLVITPPFVKFSKAKPKAAPAVRAAVSPPETAKPARPAVTAPISNEALEKKIEEILKE